MTDQEWQIRYQITSLKGVIGTRPMVRKAANEWLDVLVAGRKIPKPDRALALTLTMSDDAFMRRMAVPTPRLIPPGLAAGAVQPSSMKLETHERMVTGPATADIIARTVAQLTEVGKSYVILNDDVDAETYVQAAGTVGEDFIVERRDGCAGEHYRGDRRVSADELVTMLVGFLRGTTDWRHAISWHHVRVDFGAANAQA